MNEKTYYRIINTWLLIVFKWLYICIPVNKPWSGWGSWVCRPWRARCRGWSPSAGPALYPRRCATCRNSGWCSSSPAPPDPGPAPRAPWPSPAPCEPGWGPASGRAWGWSAPTSAGRCPGRRSASPLRPAAPPGPPGTSAGVTWGYWRTWSSSGRGRLCRWRYWRRPWEGAGAARDGTSVILWNIGEYWDQCCQ